MFNLNTVDWDLFENTLESNCNKQDETNNDFNYNTSNIDDVFTQIISKYKTTINETVPSIKITNKFTANQKSSLPPLLVELRRKRNNLQKKYKKKKTLEARIKYYETRQKYDIELCNHRSQQWERFFSGLDSKQLLSSKTCWKRINRIRTNKKSKTIPTLINDDQILDTDIKKANFFANKLHNTFNDDEVYCQTFNNDHKNQIDNWKNNYINNISEINEHQLITIQEIKQAIKKINSKESSDQHGLSNKVIKHSTPTMIYMLQELFNKCLKEINIHQHGRTLK